MPVLRRPGGVGTGGRARSGFWVFGLGAAPAAAAGQAIFLRWLSVVGALELSLWDGFDGPPGEVGGFRRVFAFLRKLAKPFVAL